MSASSSGARISSCGRSAGRSPPRAARGPEGPAAVSAARPGSPPWSQLDALALSMPASPQDRAGPGIPGLGASDQPQRSEEGDAQVWLLASRARTRTPPQPPCTPPTGRAVPPHTVRLAVAKNAAPGG